MIKPVGYCFLQWVGSEDIEVTTGTATFTTDTGEASVQLASFVDANALVNLLNSACARAFDNGVQIIKYRVAQL